MVKRLFIDFDGTLVDSRRRQYDLFVELVGDITLSVEEYWNAKRCGTNQKEMLKKYSKLPLDQSFSFLGKWMEMIEDPQRLENDELIEGVPAFLDEASKHFNLYLVTGRQSRDLLINQMLKLNIYDYFTDIFNTGQRIGKADCVRANIELGDDDVFIGDSGEDILAGKELGIFTVGVTSGASNRERLIKYVPNLIIESVSELPPLILGVQ